MVPAGSGALTHRMMTVHTPASRTGGHASFVERHAPSNTREAVVLCGLAADLAAAFVLSLAVGSTHVPIPNVIQVLVQLFGGSSTPHDSAATTKPSRSHRAIIATSLPTRAQG